MRPSSIGAISIEEADPRRPGVAEAIHAVQMAAYAQESAMLGAASFPPLARTVDDVLRAEERYVAAFICGGMAKAMVGVVGVEEGTVEAAKWSLPGDRPRPHHHIASLVVAPAHQRCGIGRRLVERVVAEHGAGLLTVSTAAANGPALALYAGLGFSIVSGMPVGTPPIEIVLLRRDGC